MCMYILKSLKKKSRTYFTHVWLADIINIIIKQKTH